MEQAFFVPVLTSRAGTLSVQTGRLPSGERVGLAFTSQASLLLAFGPPQQFVHLAGPALTGLLAPLGVKQFRIDLWRADAATPRAPEPAGARPAAGIRPVTRRVA